MYGDTETGTEPDFRPYQSFDNKQIRLKFVRKVYSILAIQILLTASIVAPFALHSGVKLWARQNPWFFTASFVASFVMLLVIVCSGEMRRRFPHNLVALTAFTVAESLLVGCLTVAFDTQTIFLAFGLTTAVCLALTLFAMQTKIDFTIFYGAMVAIGMIFFLTAMIAMFFPPSKPLILVISSIGALLISCYLVIDTQMIIGGTHSAQISPEEYCYAALTLYLDVINMFLYMLSILSAGRD